MQSMSHGVLVAFLKDSCDWLYLLMRLVCRVTIFAIVISNYITSFAMITT